MAMSGGTAKLVKSATPSGWKDPINLYVYYKHSQDISTNKSTITVGMYVVTPDRYDIGPWSDYYGSYVGTTALTFNGAIDNFYGTRWLVENKTFTVNHSSDGTGSVTIYWQWGVSSYSSYGYGSNSGSFTITLPTIPRAATLVSAPNFNDEANPKITYSNPAGNSVTSLQACISLTGANADIAYRDIPKTGTSYTFELTAAERNVLRNATTTANSRSVTFFVKTVLGGQTYHSTSSKTLSIVNATPTLSPTVTPDAATAALTGNSTTLIKYYSNVQTASGAAALKGATVTSQKTTNGTRSVSTATGTFNAVDNNSFVFTVTDSRGNTASRTITPTMVDYVKLTCNFNYTNPTAAGNMTFIVNGNYFNGSFGAADNTLAVAYRYKESGGSYGDWITLTPALSGNTYTVTETVSGLDYRTTYVFQAQVIDKLTTIDSAEYSMQSLPVFDWGKEDFNFNVPVTIEGGSVPTLVEQGTNGGWQYRKWSDGVSECWCTKTFSNIAVTNTWGNLYTSGMIAGSNLALPSGLFIEMPTIITSLATTSQGGILMAPGGTGSNTTNATYTGALEIARGVGTTGTYIINYQVKGKWK